MRPGSRSHPHDHWKLTENMKTKEICNNCGFERYRHHYCKKFETQNHSPLEITNKVVPYCKDTPEEDSRISSGPHSQQAFKNQVLYLAELEKKIDIIDIMFLIMITGFMIVMIIIALK